MFFLHVSLKMLLNSIKTQMLLYTKQTIFFKIFTFNTLSNLFLNTEMNPAMVGIIVLAMVSVILILLILCTYLWEKQQAVSRSHQESTPGV